MHDAAGGVGDDATHERREVDGEQLRDLAAAGGPQTTIRAGSTPGCAASTRSAVAKYSSGISRSVGGSPGSPK